MNRRSAGIVGLAGAIVLLVGDILLYGHFGSSADFIEGIQRVAEQASLTRLFVAGLLGPAGAVLYLAGFWHVYLNTRKSGQLAARLILVGLTTLMVTGGAYHIIWAVEMLALKYQLAEVAGCGLFLEAFGSYMTLVYITAAVPGFLAGVILFISVLTGRSRYPRWTVLANPGLLMLIPMLVGTSHLPAPLGGAIMGGYINLIFCVFFTVSIITTWKE